MFREQLVEFVHKSYEGRVLRAIGEQVTSEGGKYCLGKEGIRAVAKDISWTPTHCIRFSEHESCALVDYIKAWVEDKLGETWDWWPLQQVSRPVAPGCLRARWSSVSEA